MGTRGSRLVSCQRLVVGLLLLPFPMVHGSLREAVVLDGLLVESGTRWIEKCV